MEDQIPSEILNRIERSGVVAVIVIDDPADAVPLAEALLAGGIDVIELTLRTPSALDAMRAIRAAVPAMLIGAGTVLTADQVEAVADAGARFGVSPGLNPGVVRRARACHLPFAPGVVTPSEVEQAVELGCDQLLKFFPAEPSGGIGYLKSMNAPYAHLGLRYIPLGGLTAGNMAAYLSESAVPAIGGSWIAPRKLIGDRDWERIHQQASDARRIVDQLDQERIR